MKILRSRRLLSSILCMTALFWADSQASVAKKPEKKPDQKTGDKPSPSSLQPFDGDKTDPSFTWDQVIAGTARITVWNNSSSEQTVEAPGGDLILLASTQAATTPTTITFEVSPAAAKLGARQAMSFTISLKDSKAKPVEGGSYGGIVQIKSILPVKDPIFRAFHIAVQGPRPALSKVSFIAWRIVPVIPFWWASCQLPLAANYDSSVLPKPRIVGFLHRDPSGWASVRWTEIKQRRDGSSVALLHIDHLRSAGRYEGEINLLGIQDKTVQSSVSVTAKDFFLWPVLMICLGIYVAWKAKRYVGVMRIVWDLRKREADLGAAFQKSQQKFSDLSSGKSFVSYSVAKDISDQRVIVRSDLDTLEKVRTTSLTGNTTYGKIVKDLERLQTQIAQWPELASAAVSLDEAVNTALSDIEPSATVPKSQYSGNPVILKDVQKHLMGQPIPGAEIASLTKDLLDASSLVRTWDEANQNAIAVSKDYASIASPGSSIATQQAQLDAIKDSLIAVWTHLWQGTSAGDFATGPGTDLDSAIQAITRIKSNRQVIAAFGPPMVASSTPALDHLSTFGQVASATYSIHLPADDTQRSAMLVRAIGLWDKASVILALIIALITGLNTNYWGKPFGTFQDYAVLFLWAAGTKIGVDIITAVTDKFVSAAASAPHA